MSSATESLAAAVDTMLEQVVTAAMGPTPKRKQPEAAAPDDSPKLESNQAAHGEATAMEDDPPAKKPKLCTSAIIISTAATSAAAAAPAPQLASTLEQQAPEVDLEAAIGELMEADEPLPSTQPVASGGAAADTVAAPPCKSAAMAAVGKETSAEASADEQQQQQRQQQDSSVEMHPTQAATSGTSSLAAVLAHGRSLQAAAPAAADQPVDAVMAAPAPAFASLAVAAPTSTSPAEAEPTSTSPAAAAPTSTSPTGAAPTSASPTVAAPTGASPTVAALTDTSPLAAAPSSASKAAPAATGTTLTVPAPACTSSAVAAASPAHHPSLPTTEPAALPLPVHAACTACMPDALHVTPADHPPPTTTAPSHINLLKGDVDQDYEDEQESDSAGSGSMDGWYKSSSEDTELPHNHGSAATTTTGPAEKLACEPWVISSYELGRRVGSGGLGVVYPALHRPSGRQVALKLGSNFVQHEGHNDFTWNTFQREWNTYMALAGKELPWVPEAFEFGLVKNSDGGVAPWMTMSLLGPSLHTINQSHQPHLRQHLGAYARGMLAAMEGLHSQGLIHNDVKPANFVVAHGFDPTSSSAATSADSISQPASPQVFLIDFGFALNFDPSTAGAYYDFVGTPDFAATAVLHSRRPGLRDDLEALGYTLLELCMGEIPWDVTKHDSKAAHDQETGTWTGEQLKHMAEKRSQQWQQMVASGRVPLWLVSWISYCQALVPSATPDYDHLRRLIQQGEAEAAEVAAKAARAAANAAWLGVEE